jgi:ribonuclease HI
MAFLIINTDGGARGNPGPAGIGVVIRDENQQIIGRHKQYIGEATNNVAEYKALILALEEAKKILNFPSSAKATEGRQFSIFNGGELEIRMDSELIVRQMQGRYKIKDSRLKILAAEVLKLIKNFKNVSFHHVPREQNKEADKLVNEAIDHGNVKGAL